MLPFQTPLQNRDGVAPKHGMRSFGKAQRRAFGAIRAFKKIVDPNAFSVG
jgi:hypothetical protein